MSRRLWLDADGRSDRVAIAALAIRGRRRTRVGVRPEIQALRAVAVLLVVVYHLWPTRLTGGFVGVDVFFVLSGFLITSHLLREVDVTGSVSLRDFWARRIRRLLPAAFVVLGVSAVFAVLFLPESGWQQTFSEVRASAIYIENWVLAVNAVDYLAAENSPSIVQHFWSLSVEEQFYFVWPLLVLVALAISARSSIRRTRSVGATLIVVTVMSLAVSIWLSYAAPAQAYFVTPTRAWEFAVGGLLAITPLGAGASGAPVARIVASWVGLALIVLTAITLDGSVNFPGWIALLPTVGAMLVIVGGNVRHVASPSYYGALPPIQWLGDLSYSIYLWHWPIIIIALQLTERISFIVGGAVIALTLVLAALTKRYVEDPFRRGAFWNANPRRAFVLAAGGMALIVGATTAVGAGLSTVQEQREAEALRIAECLGVSPISGAECVGVVPTGTLYPPLSGLGEDTGGQYTCYIDKGQRLESCEYGDPDSPITIALVGDSHAASLIPGLSDAAERQGWFIRTFVGDGCRLGYPEGCSAGKEIQAEILSGNFDAVLVAGIRQYQPSEESLIETWEPLLDRGVNIVPIVDVPTFVASTLQCVEETGGRAVRAELCATEREVALATYPDRYGPAGEELGLPIIDLTSLFCGVDTCPAVIGNVIVYRDVASHITSTFSRSLSWAIEERLSEPLTR